MNAMSRMSPPHLLTAVEKGNLRSSPQTELAEIFPSHVVCAWLGNSEDVAKKHYYYHVTDARRTD